MTKLLINRFKWTLANAALVISSHCADHRDLLFTLRCGRPPQQRAFWVILTKAWFFLSLHVKKKKNNEAQLTALWWWLTRQRATVCSTQLLSPGNNTSSTDENRPDQTNNWVNDEKGNKKTPKKTHTPFSCSVMSDRHRCLKMTNKAQ